MRFRLLFGSFAAASVLCLSMLPAACSSSDDSNGTVPPAEAGSSSGSSGTSGSSGSSGDASDVDAADASKKPTSTDCKLTALSAADVTPKFVVYHSPDVVPPTQTGGTLSGNYKVTDATVYLPKETAILAGNDPPMGSGTVNAWAEFSGTRYMLHNKSDLTVTAGKQSLPIKTTVDSQGGFTVATEKLTLDYSCDTTQPADADYSFTDDGSGTATILIHTVTNYSGLNLDGYILLTATKN